MNRVSAILGLFLSSMMFPYLGVAQEALSVSVTPPMIQLTIGPGETWSSSLKIINSNTYDLTYYATPVDFEADGEEGKGSFMPILDTSESSLGSWVEISREPIMVPRGSSKEVPFTVRIPEGAPPGGQYAAILVGTTPGEGAIEGPTVKVSSYVSTLLFVRIKGEIDERARIREFRTDHWFYQDPAAQFVLRLENMGNTHLRPKGEIVLYNMWGKERGRVHINQKSSFGNVLPKSIRRFSFEWQGEKSLFDIGRYSAVATISYGEDQQKNISGTTYFWVIPVVPVSITLGSLLGFTLLVTWLIRRYVRRALALERERFGIAEDAPNPSPTVEVLLQPLRVGAVDLRSAAEQRRIPPGSISTRPRDLSLLGTLKEYSLFFFFIAVMVAAAFWIWMYFESVLIPEREYEITNVRTSEEEMSSE